MYTRHWPAAAPTGLVPWAAGQVRGRVRLSADPLRRLMGQQLMWHKAIHPKLPGSRSVRFFSSSATDNNSHNSHKSPYLVLGIPKSATQQDIKRAFQKVRLRE